MSTSEDQPHVALLSSSGVGHLTPCLRLAALLVNHHCRVTLVTSHPIASLAESKLISCFLSAFPQVVEKQFHVLPLDPTTVKYNDSFWIAYETLYRSANQLLPLLSSLSPPLSAVVSDVSLLPSVLPFTTTLNLPNYLLFTSGATMFSFFSYYPIVASKLGSDFSSSCGIEIPGVSPMPKEMISPSLLDPDSFASSILKEDCKKVTKFSGILINSFEKLEPEALAALEDGKVVDGLPPLFTIGLRPCEFEKAEESGEPLKWLDGQSAGSVVYVCFGSRVAMGREQIRELGKGLIESEFPFMWVVKDKEDEDSLDEILGDELVEKMKKKGLVVKKWVNQGEILGHNSVGGFVSHSGWNSVMEAVWHGVPLLAWPQISDQKINAGVVERNGIGVWDKSWGWFGEGLVKGEEIGKRIKELMGNETIRLQIVQMREEARKASGAGGVCDNALKKLIHEWTNGRGI